MNQEKPKEPKLSEDEEMAGYAGQLEEDPTPWKNERISEEQRVEWFEAEHLLEERLRQVDPRLKADFLEMREPKTRTLSDPHAEKMVPVISIRFGSTEVMAIKGSRLNRQTIDLKSLKDRLDEIAKEVSGKVEGILRKTDEHT